MRKKILMILVMLIVIAGVCNAVIINVDPYGTGDFLKIQNAINASINGDIIIVMPGIYNENVNYLNKDIILQSSEPTNPLIIETTQITPPDNYVIGSDGTLEGFRLNGCFKIEAYSPTIRNCHIVSPVFHGITSHVPYHGVNYPLIENNIIEAEVGIYIFTQASAYGSYPMIRNNIFIGKGLNLWGCGIYCRTHNEICEVYNNIFMNFQWAINFTYDSLFDQRIQSIKHNNFWNNLMDGISQSNHFKLTGQQGNISANPLFIDPANGDYHLRFSSPCIDAGFDAGVYEDMDGNIRPLDGDNDLVIGFDIGPYEKMPVTDSAVIIAKPTSLYFIGTEGGDNPAKQTVIIRNGGTGVLSWKIIEECPWLKVLGRPKGSTRDFSKVSIAVDIDGLELGSYDYQLPIYSSNAVNSSEIVTINLIINGIINVPDDFTTIQEAIDAANGGDHIVLSNGIYTGTGNKDLDFHGKKITLQSQNGPADCIIDCQNSGRGFYFHSGETKESKIQGITIRNGRAFRNGGGAIFCEGGSVEISNCILNNNRGSFGGAVYNLSDITINNCIISGNYASSEGGGIRGVNITMINCIVSGNEARGFAGGIATLWKENKIINCNIVGNKTSGGSIGSGGILLGMESDTYLQNCIVRDNISDGGSQIAAYSWSYGAVKLHASYNNIIGGLSNIYNRKSIIYWLDGNIDTNPLFELPGYWSDDIWYDGDYHLQETSSCIDAGDPNFVTGPNATDLDINPRIVNGRIDMGAYEFQLQDPTQMILDLIQDVIDLNLHGGISNSFESKLNNVLKKLEDFNDNNDVAAINSLQSFINAVEAQRGNKVYEEDADYLIDVAQQVIDMLNTE